MSIFVRVVEIYSLVFLSEVSVLPSLHTINSYSSLTKKHAKPRPKQLKHNIAVDRHVIAASTVAKHPILVADKFYDITSL